MNNILVPYDFQAQSNIALEQAINLARHFKSTIVLLHVSELHGLLPSIFADGRDEEIIEKINDQLDAIASRVSLTSGIPIIASLQKGRVYSVISKVADDLNASFIVMGTRNTDGGSPEKMQMVGANTSRIIRSAKCPVITIGGSSHHNGCRAILLPLDLSKESKQKTGWAIDMAKIYGARIRAVSALWSMNNPEIIERLEVQINEVKKFIEAAGVVCDTDIIESPEGGKTHVPAILDYARSKGDVDMIVIMTQQEFSIIEYFLGSNAQEFIRCSEIPVVSIVPKEMGFVSILS